MANAHGSSSHAKQSVIEEGSEFRGTLSSSCGVLVRGRVEGNIEAPSLTVAAGGSVSGKVRVTELRSDGEISGELDADRVELAGSVRDRTVVRSRLLEVKLATEGGKLEVVFGSCELAVGDDPLAGQGETP